MDFQALRDKAGNLTQAEIVKAAARLGWAVSTKRGKGGHVVLAKDGHSIAVAVHANTYTDKSIIDDLERWS